MKKTIVLLIRNQVLITTKNQSTGLTENSYISFNKKTTGISKLLAILTIVWRVGLVLPCSILFILPFSNSHKFANSIWLSPFLSRSFLTLFPNIRLASEFTLLKSYYKSKKELSFNTTLCYVCNGQIQTVRIKGEKNH